MAKMKEAYAMLTYEVNVTWPLEGIPNATEIDLIAKLLQEYADKSLGIDLRARMAGVPVPPKKGK